MGLFFSIIIHYNWLAIYHGFCILQLPRILKVFFLEVCHFESMPCRSIRRVLGYDELPDGFFCHSIHDTIACGNGMA